MRSLLALALVLSAAPAFADDSLLIGIGGGYGVNPLSPPTVTPFASANFGQDNAQYSGNNNNALKTDGGSAGAFYVPSTTTNSWFVYLEGTTNDSPVWLQNNTAVETALSKCVNMTCSGANDDVFKVNSYGTTEPFAVTFSMKRSSPGQMWQAAGSAPSVSVTAGSGYTNGVYNWTATGGGCSVEPAGVVGVGYAASGQLSSTFVKITNPGSGCTSTPSVSVPAGAGSGTGGAITLAAPTVGTGIVTAPGQRWCAVIGEYGSDQSTVTQGSQFVAMVDNNGNPLSGSPAMVTTSNTSWFSGQSQSTIGDVFNLIGSGYITANTYQSGWGGSLGNVGMIWGAFPISSGAPSASVLAQLCTKSSDPFAYFNSTFGSSNVRSFYRLNDTGTWSDSSTGNGGSPWANASVVGTVTAGAPIAPGPALTLTSNGPMTISPVTNYSAGTGSIALSGTYNVATLGGTPSAIQAQVSTTPASCTAISGYGPGCGWVGLTGGSIAGGVWSGSLPSVPGGAPYYINVRPANGASYVAHSDSVGVGLVVALWGQSQLEYFTQATNVGDTIASASAVNNLAIDGVLDPPSHTVYQTSTAPVGGLALMRASHRSVDAASFQANGYVPMVDGVGAFAINLSKLSGWPVEVVILAVGGQAVDEWDEGYLTVGTGVGSCATVSLSGSGAGPYAGTAAWNIGCLPVAGALNGGTAINVVEGGSMKFYVGGTLAASDSGPYAYGVGSSTSCTGENGYTVSACSINYLTGAVSITFSSTPSSAPTIQWTNIEDLQSTGLYSGADIFGDGSPTSGHTSAVMARAPNGFSLIIAEQCTANEGEFTANGYSAAAASMTGKDSYLLGTKLPAYFAQVSATTPIMPLQHFRELNLASGYNLAGTAGCNQWTRELGTAGSGHSYTGAGPFALSGPYLDDAILQATLTGDNPHETTGVYGGQRLGRRMAADAWAFLSGNPALTAKPALSTSTIAACDASATSSPCFDIGSTYAGETSWTCSGTAGTSSNCIDVSWSLTATGATSLRTCGTNLSAGVNPPTGSCADGGLGQPVAGFRIGTSSSSVSSGDLLDDGLDPVSNAFPTAANGQTTGLGFQCAQVASTVVQCHKTTGAWSSGATYISYGDYSAAGRAGRLGGAGSVATANYSGGGSYTVTSAGSGCATANGVVNVTQSSFTATTKPAIQFVISSNAIIAAFPSTAGVNITNAATISYPTGCTGTISLPTNSPGSWIYDFNTVGQLLYDNAGSSGTLSTILNGYEPGNPASTFGLITAVAVSG